LAKQIKSRDTHRVLEVTEKIETTINGERLDGLPARSITGEKFSRSISKFLKKLKVKASDDQLSVEAHKTKSLRQLGNEYGVSHEAVRRIPRRIGMFDLI
jgi:hypothetical protein